MKIGNWQVGKITEKFKGFWASGGTASTAQKKFYPGQFPYSERCRHYDELLDGNANAKSAVWSAAGRTLENGLFLVATDKYDRAIEAKERCEELNKRVDIETLIYNTIVQLLAHGSCFWEKSIDPIFDVRLIPNQESIVPLEADANGEVTKWGMNIVGGKGPTWGASEIVHFYWMRTSQSYPYGTSLFTGCETEIGILEQLELDIKEHMHRTAFPQVAIGVGNDKSKPTSTEVNEIRNSIKKWQPGEIHATSYELTQANISGDRPIQNLGDVLEFCKDNLTDSFMISPISKLYNSTEASSKEMAKSENARMITPLQTLIGNIVEKEVYKPYLEWLGFSVRVVPEVMWENPDAENGEKATYWTQLVSAGVVPAEYAAEQLGFDLDKIEELRKKEQQRQLEQQQEMAQFQKTQPFQKQGQQSQGKSDEVWEVRKKPSKQP